MYFSELITAERTKDLICNHSNMILKGGTDTGKTTYICNQVSKVAKRILYFCPRTKLAESLKHDIRTKGINNIDVRLTQGCEQRIIRGTTSIQNETDNIISNYDVVVYDEIHCVIDDTGCNNGTDLTCKLVEQLLQNVNISVILISATGDYIFKYFIDKGMIDSNNIFEVAKDYSFLTCVPLSNTADSTINMVESLLFDTPKEEKIIYFCSKIERGTEAYNRLQQQCDVMFACSLNTKDSYAKKINRITEITDTFNAKVLIATTAIDVGINLKDIFIKHIVTDIYNINSLVQCVGRKRIISKSDNVTLYFRNWTKYGLNEPTEATKKELEQIELFKVDTDAFNLKYYKRDDCKSKYIYMNPFTRRQELNIMGEIKLEQDYINYLRIIENNFKCLVSERFTGCKMLPEKKVIINSFIRSKIIALEGKELYKDEQKQLAKILDIRSRNRELLYGYGILNEYITQYCKGYTLSKERRAKGRTFWKVQKT